VTRAVVFAYHNVGVRCLKVLLAHRIDVALVVTHDDDPREAQWFGSVAATARENGIGTITPEDPNVADVVARVAALAPDLLFSFYYRRMLGAALLAVPARGALNMHGSLLPKFRGRAPVNWAVLAGESETGATLHYMTIKPDDGDIVAQTAVPILPDDTAREVFDKVTVAAEMTLDRVLPALVAGNAPRTPQDLSRGSYFGGRRPEDGIIDWNNDATMIHNLVRAVAPPYPGAFTAVGGVQARILRTRVADAAAPRASPPVLEFDGNRAIARCGGGGALDLLAIEVDSALVAPSALAQRFGAGPVRLGSTGK
jgi:methionyl-tRNA formyltransferase